jgi:hypothetical protein
MRLLSRSRKSAGRGGRAYHKSSRTAPRGEASSAGRAGPAIRRRLRRAKPRRGPGRAPGPRTMPPGQRWCSWIRKREVLGLASRKLSNWTSLRIQDLRGCSHDTPAFETARPETGCGSQRLERQRSRSSARLRAAVGDAQPLRRNGRRVRAVHLPGLLRARPRERLSQWPSPEPRPRPAGS